MTSTHQIPAPCNYQLRRYLLRKQIFLRSQAAFAEEQLHVLRYEAISSPAYNLPIRSPLYASMSREARYSPHIPPIGTQIPRRLTRVYRADRQPIWCHTSCKRIRSPLNARKSPAKQEISLASSLRIRSRSHARNRVSSRPQCFLRYVISCMHACKMICNQGSSEQIRANELFSSASETTISSMEKKMEIKELER